VTPGRRWNYKCCSVGWRVSETVQAVYRGGRPPTSHCQGISTSYKLGTESCFMIVNYANVALFPIYCFWPDIVWFLLLCYMTLC